MRATSFFLVLFLVVGSSLASPRRDYLTGIQAAEVSRTVTNKEKDPDYVLADAAFRIYRDMAQAVMREGEPLDTVLGRVRQRYSGRAATDPTRARVTRLIDTVEQAAKNEELDEELTMYTDVSMLGVVYIDRRYARPDLTEQEYVQHRRAQYGLYQFMSLEENRRASVINCYEFNDSVHACASYAASKLTALRCGPMADFGVRFQKSGDALDTVLVEHA